MATRARPSAHALQIHRDVNPESEDDPVTQKDTDLILRKAIQYLAIQGGSDPVDVYVSRVNDINEEVLQEYRTQGYPYDPQLYRQLQLLVREVQSAVPAIDQDISTPENSDTSIEELSSPTTLHREGEELDCSAAGRQAPHPATLSPRLQGPRKAEVIETQYLYGGPNNEVEEWHKDFPAALPFGETLYMQEWESMKINFDLAESTKSLYADGNPIVTTNVPYEAVEARIGTPAQYDSGSRFKIPGKIWRLWDQVKNAAMNNSSLAARVDEFNQGGDPQELENKDYAPRVFLPKVSVEPKPRSRSLGSLGTSTPAPDLFPSVVTDCLTGKQPARRNYNRPTATSVQNSAPSYEAINPGAGIRGQSLTPTPAPRRPFVDTPALKALKKFDLRRTAAVGGTTPAAMARSAAKPKKASQASVSRTLQYVQAGPSTSRKPGRSRKDSLTVAPSVPTVSATRARGQKRKASDTEYVPTPSSPEAPAKKSRTTASPKPKKTGAKTPVGKKSVMFARNEAPPTPGSGSKKPAGVKKSAIKKGKEAGSVPEVLAKDVRTELGSPVKRGTTRSGTKFN